MTSVVIPALNEAVNIRYVIELAAGSASVSEVIVVDDGSTDETRELAGQSGARVITSSLLGKGASMEDGLRASQGDIIVYLDGDIRGLSPNLIDQLIEPLLEGRADFAKAKFSRSAGRVTTLTANPLIRTFFPELAHFAQPLGGIIAVRRQLLERLTFETDYGVDLALLIDAHFAALVSSKWTSAISNTTASLSMRSARWPRRWSVLSYGERNSTAGCRSSNFMK